MFGKAVLGIAGAYLLRAVAESGTVAKLPLLIVAIVYAGMWLVWAVRTHATNRFASVTYAITAALILSPLLWESTVRFQVLSPVFTAAVLVAFVVLALALAWRQNLQAIPWVATLAAVVTALALIIATRELVPFTVGLLAVALATEVVICLGQQLSVRVVPAIAADFAVWLLVYVMTSPEGVPPEYRPVECNYDHAALPGAACDLRWKHWPAQLWVAPPADDLRNRAGSCGVCAGDFWDAARKSRLCCCTRRLFPGGCGGVLLGRAVAIHSGWTKSKSSGVRDLCGCTSAGGDAAAFSCGLPGTVLVLGCGDRGFLVHAYRQAKPRHARLLLSGGGGDLLWPSESCGERSGGNRTVLSGCRCMRGRSLRRSVLRNRMAGFDRSMETAAALDRPLRAVAGTAAALAVMVIVRLGSASGMLNASRLSVVRTVVTCSLALILGFSGSRLKRAELLWVAYVAIAFGTLKLLFEDLRFGNAASLVASLLFYGLILILIPRLTRFSGDRS